MAGSGERALGAVDPRELERVPDICCALKHTCRKPETRPKCWFGPTFPGRQRFKRVGVLYGTALQRVASTFKGNARNVSGCRLAQGWEDIVTTPTFIKALASAFCAVIVAISLVRPPQLVLPPGSRLAHVDFAQP